MCYGGRDVLPPKKNIVAFLIRFVGTLFIAALIVWELFAPRTSAELPELQAADRALAAKNDKQARRQFEKLIGQGRRNRAFTRPSFPTAWRMAALTWDWSTASGPLTPASTRLMKRGPYCICFCPKCIRWTEKRRRT